MEIYKEQEQIKKTKKNKKKRNNTNYTMDPGIYSLIKTNR